MSPDDLIVGAGGGGGKGGGGGGSATEAKDNLESKAYARIIDLIGEGEIEGFATPAKANITRGTVEYDVEALKDIFFDNTPILNSAAVVRSVTYSQDGANIVCTFNGHGYSQGEELQFFVKTGGAINAAITLTAISANTFTAKTTNGVVTSGNGVVAKRSDFNYKDVKVYTRFGTANQTRIPFGPVVSEEISVAQIVEKNTPITKTITDTNTDQVRVTLTVPQLQRIEDDGDIVGAEVQFRILLQYKGGGFEPVIDDTITGRTGDQYQRSYLIDLRRKAPSDFPVQVRVQRVTDDSNTPKLANSLVWTSYSEIIRTRLNYPHSALVGLEVSAEQFDRIPERKYRTRDLKIPIPSNATVERATGRLIYSGVWNGTFGAAQWTTDPAWCLWALLTTSRWGFGSHINASQLDKWAFYAASQYCSELVPDGFGGQEPRFSCNVNIQALTEAYKLINDMCSVFRAMPYWSTGALTVSQDKPSDPAYLFTMANVTEEGFAYSGSDIKTRPNVAVVQYLNLETRDVGYEQVEDRVAIQKYGAIPTEITAFACTSRGQAARVGEWVLYASQYETEVVTFTATISAGVLVRPGQIIEIADPVRAGSRRGGRIVSGTTTSIVIDNGDGLEPAGTVKIIMPDGSVESRTCTRSGTTLTLGSALPKAPLAGSVWIYSSATLQPSQWRVLTVGEQDGSEYPITALSYNSSKYDYIERDRPLQFRDVTNLNQLPPAPTNLAITETLYTYQDQVRSKIIANWRPVLNVNQYHVKWRKDNGNWNRTATQSPDHEILNITPGVFEFEVYSFAADGRLSTSALRGTINALGKTAPPSNVTGLTYQLDSAIGVTLSWDAVPDLDLREYEVRRGTTWASATLITTVKATSYKIGYLDNGSYTYLVKARDTSGVESVTAAAVSIGVTPPSAPSVTFSVQGDVAALTWTASTGSYAPAYYEVRYGDSFAAGVSVGQYKTTAVNIPITWSGNRTFWVAAVDPVGTVGTAGSVTVNSGAAPAPTITSTFGSDSVTLRWNEVNGTTKTRFYEVRRGATFATAAVLASIQATSYIVRIDWSGNETFWVVAIDANGNQGAPGSAVVTVGLAGPTNLTSTFAGDQVVLSWDAVKGSIDTAGYQIRRGDTFATATIITQIQSTTYSIKADWSQTTRFWVAAVNVAGVVGAGTSVDVVVAPPLQPTISQQVIDNNVLLRWNDCTTVLPIVYYELRKGATWATATLIGTKQGRFTTVFETASGTYTYWLAAVDSGGNVGTPGSINAVVNQPPDYVLQSDQNSTFSGTKTNLFLESGVLYANVNTTETWQSHFTSRGWNTPQDQINAGFPIYAMPSLTTGLYEETIDYGSVIPGSRIASSLTNQVVAGSTTITPRLSVKKLVGDAWTDYNNVSEVYATDFRYVKVRYDFSSAGGDDLLAITNLNIRLDVKVRTDGGSGTANAGDVGGTTVNFTIPFVDVQSITVTPSGTAARFAVYDFVDTPNPTSFKVLLFDNSGNRVTGGFSWTAKGA